MGRKYVVNGLINQHTILRSHSKSKTFINSCSTSSEVEEEEHYYSALLRKCVEISNIRLGRSVHAKLIKSWYVPNSTFLSNHIINMYLKIKCDHNHRDFVLHDALQLFDEMSVSRNVVTWSSVIVGLVRCDRHCEARALFCRMHFSGARPNAFTLVSALHAISNDGVNGDHMLLYQIYALAVRLGFLSNVFLMNAFMTALVRHGRLGEAMTVFETLGGSHNRDVVSWNVIMAGYLHCSYLDSDHRLFLFWCRMNKEGVKPDHFTFSTLFTGLANLCHLQMGLQVHALLVKCGHGAEICVGNSLVDMYLKNRCLVDGLKAFREMPFSDVPSWTQMAAGCLHCGEPGRAIATIEEMMKAGIKPNKFTLATLINACANLVSLEQGKKAHGLRVKLGNVDMDVCVDNALVDMYAKCGCMDDACIVFESMEDKSSIVSWTTMIMGYAQNGQAKEALNTFDRMRIEGVDPNKITFICVLYACSQGGFIDEGVKYFVSMSQDHGMEPEEDHYACMVDLYGRAGRIKEAEELILKMPMKPGGVVVWQTLLGACREHGNMETGLRAAEQALSMDKMDSSTYVLLSNMFAGLKNWDGVGELRKLMECRDVTKMGGSSWI